MTQVAIPQSVQDYMHHAGVRSAVDHLLEAGTAELPHGLERWDEVRAFHRAYLSACQVRAEHALFLMDLWEAIWGRTISETGLPLRPLTPTEQHDMTNDIPVSPDDIWDSGWAFTRVFETNDKQARCFTGVTCWNDVGLVLYFNACDIVRDHLLSDQYALPSSWEREADDDGYRSTKEGLMPVPNGALFDVTKGRELAAAAIIKFSWPVR